MNPERLLAHYERIADAPDAITRLRRFVLDLAVRGKLVPQDPSDEPASELLKGIAAEKARMIVDGKVRNAKAPSALAQEEGAPVRKGWALVRGFEVFLSRSGNSKLIKGKLHAEPNESRFPGYSAAGQDVWLDHWEHEGDAIVLSAVGARCGKAFLASGRWSAVANTHIIWLMPTITDPAFAMLHLNNEKFWIRSGGAQPFVKVKETLRNSFPLPPLAEQHRIVAMVDELMALCDRLEEERARREAVRDRLTTASLTRLTAPDAEAEAFKSHARFALDTLPALTTRPDQIRPLRQSILDLAVSGKLVEQNPEDQPVAIEARVCSPTPTYLPNSWRFAPLQQILSEDTRNGYSRKPDDAPNGVPMLRISAGTVRQDGLVAEEEHKLISGIDESARLQYGLKGGDLLACRFNGNKSFVGRLTLFTDYLNLNPIYPDKLIRVRIASQFALPEFIRIAGETGTVRAEIEEACATTVGNWGISASNLKKANFPLPPLAEQHRIVAKVDALMALCDRLEASLVTADTTRRRLLEALLHEALEPAAREMEAAE